MYKILTENDSDDWKKLSSYEESFFYPMGQDTMFKIKHGNTGLYFDFFKTIGNFITIVFYNEEQDIISCITGIHTQNNFYICDYKSKLFDFNRINICMNILKDIFSKLEKDISFYFVNMSSPENNKMISLVERLYKLPITKNSLYLTTFTKNELDKSTLLISTSGYKDIIVDNKPVNLFHIHEKGCISIDSIPEDSLIMKTSTNKLKEDSKEITIGCFNCNVTYVPSFYI